jgi:hypothetical protein
VTRYAPRQERRLSPANEGESSLVGPVIWSSTVAVARIRSGTPALPPVALTGIRYVSPQFAGLRWATWRMLDFSTCRDHTPIQQIEACGVGMAGAFYGERRWGTDAV